MSFIIIAIFAISISCSTADFCPDEEDLAPCVCKKDGIFNLGSIVCEAPGQDLDLKKIFTRLYEEKSGPKRYWGFKLGDSNIKEIPENVFGNITFGRIEISGASQLEKIHSKAFISSRAIATQLLIGNPIKSVMGKLNDLPSPYSLMELANSFESLTALAYLAGIKSVPNFALYPKLHSLNLLHLEFHDNSNDDTLLGENNFATLTQLTELSISYSNLKHVHTKALTFLPSQKPLTIFFRHNQLNGSSFQDLSFSSLNREFGIVLDDNKIDYLEEKVFAPFLTSGSDNKIQSLMKNPINCTDCRNNWIFKMRSKLGDKIKNTFCGGKDDKQGDNNIWKNESKFAHCKS